MLEVKQLININEWRWSKFIKMYKTAPFFLSIEWKRIIEKVFHFEPYYYYVVNEKNEIIAVAPFFLVQSFIFGNRLISLPFTDYGGFYFKNEITLEEKNSVLELLFKEIGTIVKKHKLNYVEIRGERYDDFFKEDIKYFSNTPYVTFRIDLTRPFATISNKFSRSIKRAISKNNLKGPKNRIKIIKCEEKKILNKVYDMYARDLRRFGSPPLSKLYLECQWDILKEKNMFEVFLAYYNNQIIGAKTFLIFEKQVYGELSVSDQRFTHMTPKTHLYYETLQWASDQNYNFYDFGRTRRQCGSYEHKRKWGGEEKNIDYSFLIYNKGADTALDASQVKFHWPQQIFKMLPLFCSKRIGPAIRRNLGK